MRRPLLAVILLLALEFPCAPQSPAARRREHPDTGGVLHQLSIAAFGGSGQNTIQALETDSGGNIFVTGTTNSPDFPVKNAAQPAFGDATILRTTDLGVTWTRLASPPGVVGTVAPDPAAPQILYANTSIGLFKSPDGGQTWQALYAFASNPQYAGAPYTGALVVDPGNHVHLAADAPNGSVLRSLDGGVTWTSATLPLTCGGSQLIADPNGSGTLVETGFPGPLCISRDWGLTFNAVVPFNAVPPQGGNTEAVALVPTHPGWIYVGAGYGVFGSLFLSTDYGATWTAKGTPSGTFSAFTGLAVDPDQPTTLVADTLGGYFKSTDGGSSWTAQTSGPGAGGPGAPGLQSPFALVSHQCNPTGGLFAIVSGPGYFAVAFSPDDGATFNAPQLSHITSVVTGPNCAAYAIRQPGTLASDAFVAKLAPNGQPLWATFLGGSDIDAPVALAVDAQGNAYITGNTASPDFPQTVPRIGVPGSSAVFVTKYSPDGKITYSAIISGEAANSIYALAVDLSQNAYVLGYTDSLKFPTTPGALVSTLASGSYSGFLTKLSPNASVVFSTYLGQSYTHPGAIYVGADDQPVLAGSGAAPGLPAPPQGSYPDFLVKLDPTGSRVVQATYLPGSSSNFGPTAVRADASGNLVVFSTTDVANDTFISGPYTALSTSCLYSLSDAYLTKLKAADWSTIYTVLLPCGNQTGSMAINTAGAVVLALGPGPGFPLQTPLVGAPGICGNAAVAKLSPDGSALEFSTYLGSCSEVPGLALASDGSIYAGTGNTVLHLPATNAAPISLNQIANAFSNDSSAVVGGGLYSLSVSGFQPSTIDLGLNPKQNLPAQLGGVQVTFDGVPAAILRVSPGQVIVAPPWFLPAHAGARSNPPPPSPYASQSTFTLIEVSYNGTHSNAVWMPVASQDPGLLTTTFPGLPPSGFENFPDGNVRNQDNTPNSATNPAAAGSTVTVFATGMEVMNPAGAPGAIATSQTVVGSTYTSWSSCNQDLMCQVSNAYTLPGFVSGLVAIPVQVPTSSRYFNGTDAGNGVQRVEFNLTPYSPISEGIYPPPTSVIGIYVKVPTSAAANAP